MKNRFLNGLLFSILMAFSTGMLVGCEGVTIDENGNVIEVVEQGNETSEVEPDGKDETGTNIEPEIVDTLATIDNNSVDYTLNYLDFMKAVTKGILVNAETITQMSKNIGENPQIINDSEFRTTVSELVDIMNKTHLSVVDITPPDMLSTYHSLMLGSLEEYSKGAKLFEDGILNGKSELVDESLKSFVVAIKLYNEATNELTRISE